MKRKLTKIFFKMVESNGKKIMPPCHQCEGAGATCYRKTHGPGCWRCSQWKIGCSMVEAKKRKGKETEVIKVKQSGKENRVETGETDRRTEAMEAMVTEMRRIADEVEALVAGQQEIIAGIDRVVEEQRLLGFGVEVLWRKIEEGMGEKSKGKEKKTEKGKGKEKGVETERITEETMMERDGEETDGDGEDEAGSAPIS